VGYFCILKKLPKVNNRPIGENSPNLATLLLTIIGQYIKSDSFSLQIITPILFTELFLSNTNTTVQALFRAELA
jgi:hypothetical protein